MIPILIPTRIRTHSNSLLFYTLSQIPEKYPIPEISISPKQKKLFSLSLGGERGKTVKK